MNILPCRGRVGSPEAIRGGVTEAVFVARLSPPPGPLARADLAPPGGDVRRPCPYAIALLLAGRGETHRNPPHQIRILWFNAGHSSAKATGAPCPSSPRSARRSLR